MLHVAVTTYVVPQDVGHDPMTPFLLSSFYSEQISDDELNRPS